MITQKTKYAHKALTAMAEAKAGGQPALRIKGGARRSGGPKRFLEHILLDLKRAGYIGSRRGRNGGNELIKDPSKISIGEILRNLDGPIAPLPCLSRRACQRCEDCSDEETCRIRQVFGRVFWSDLLLIELLTFRDLLIAPDALEMRSAEAIPS